jgi:hypothetical protein
MTTAPTNEMLALADELDGALNAFLHAADTNDKAEFSKQLERVLWDNKAGFAAYLRLSATTSPRDVREALENIDRVLEHKPGTPGLSYDSTERLLESALAFAQFAKDALSNLDAAAPAAGGDDLPKRPFAFAVRRAPENGPDQWRLFMDEGEARAEAEQLDGDYEALFKVGDRRSAVTDITVGAQIASAVRVWLECPEGKRPSAQALGARVAEIASGAALTAPAAKAPAVSEADVGRESEGRFWLELREPNCVPERKGPFHSHTRATVLREFMEARPSAFISVVTLSHDGPDFQDGPECLMMADGRSTKTALKHIESSKSAYSIQSAAQGGGTECCIPTDGEPSFVLLGRDPQAPELVEQWARDRLRYEPDSDKPLKAFKIAREMRGFKNRNPELGMAFPSDPPSQEASAPVAYLRDISGTDEYEALAVCIKGDPGAFPVYVHAGDRP